MIWLIGHKGMLGREVLSRLEKKECLHEVSDMEVDIADINQLTSFIGSRTPDWMVNCSAYTAVDRAEDEAPLAFRVNADGVRNLARVAKEKGAKFLHISTDYVFDGESRTAYTEEDLTNPIGVYARSKYQGEIYVRQSLPRHFIIRTAWLYGRHGQNFVYTMLRLFQEREELRVVADQWGSPTLADDLADAILEIIGRNSEEYGTYHFTNEGKTNWYEFTQAIHRHAISEGLIKREVRILPIDTEQYPTKAKRPANSLMSKDKIKTTFGLTIRDWEAALEAFMKAIAS
jgi:dTDP-4-dehydrorhamnose reductase